MPTTSLPLPAWHQLLLVAPALVALGAAVTSLVVPVVGRAWRAAGVATAAMLLAAGGSVAAHALTRPGGSGLVRSDSVGVTVLALVTFIGWAVVRFSRAYLAGEPRQREYLGRMLATIGCVAVIVVANNLVLLAAAWTATSLALHGLLAFYRERPVAVAVAHKKFILARCADVAMVGAIVAFGTTFHTLRIDRIVAQANAVDALPTGARVGVLLIAVAAVLKCAQVPFHGWLIQVMEAPTPVSALLHAGVVNLGGFVLLRFASVVDRAVETRTLLVVMGTTTAVLAALVMTTRVSVKVALAWSTCAQMGFMLLQCGLGLWPMALLHLVAHSLYKAHAFLSAGGTVRDTQRRLLGFPPRSPSMGTITGGVALSAVGVFVAGWSWSRLPFAGAPSAALWLMGGVVALAAVPLALGTGPVRLGAFLVPLAYFGLHTLFERLVPSGAAAPVAMVAGVAAAFALLFAAQTLVALTPASPFARRLHPWCFGGFFLDDVFTRVAFAAWPPPRAVAHA